ncbi:MAG: aldehyde dehydrogenase [Planctomycetes bacterium]|nr:aldehyde dehydrogenase [Planctomycetota bacterium]
MSEILEETETLKSINPATGDLVGEVPVADAVAVRAAVAHARAALPAWRALSVAARREYLAPAQQALLDQLEELSALVTAEMGKPLADARGEVSYTASSLPGMLDELEAALAPEVIEDERVRSEVHYEPHGVCAVITPWNFPLLMPHTAVIPALMAGNAVILKPSEESPLVAAAYVEALAKGLPEGVLQVVQGGDATGQALVAADVNLIAFTGSRETGKAILRAASEGLKRVILELGGKDPLVVLEDADVEQAAGFAVRNGFRNAGQVCVSTERIFVHEAIAGDFEAALAEKVAALKVGPGTEPEVTVGPMVNARQKAHVVAQVEAALASGARLVAGGEPREGNYVQPTVLADVDPHASIMRDETFGPVVCVGTFATDAEAIELANDTPFGLGAAVFGAQEHAAYVARQVEAGMVGVNRGCGGAEGSPWVGAKESGYGFHSGVAGHRQFAIPRVVSAAKPHD